MRIITPVTRDIKPCHSLPTAFPSVQSQVTYGCYQPGPGESFAEVLLRTGKLAETESQGAEAFPTTEGMARVRGEVSPPQKVRPGFGTGNESQRSTGKQGYTVSNSDSLTRYRHSFI